MNGHKDSGYQYLLNSYLVAYSRSSYQASNYIFKSGRMSHMLAKLCRNHTHFKGINTDSKYN